MRPQPPRLVVNGPNPNRLLGRMLSLERGRLPAIQLFIPSSIHTAPGLRQAITATSGNRAKRKVRETGAHTPADAGFTPTPAGPGFPKSPSVGQLIITDAGRVCAALVGSGFRATNGPGLGFLAQEQRLCRL